MEPVLDGRTDAAYYDLTLEKTITPTDGEPKTTTMTLSGESLQVIFVVPDEFQGHSDYNIINIYDGDAEELSDRDEEMCIRDRDRSMVGGYGQDDRVCAYTALKAILDTKAVKITAVCVLVDKEEIVSMGLSLIHS